MERTWNPLWADIWDEKAPAEYADAVRRTCLASVNWIESHPGVELNWQERNRKDLIDAADLPEGVTENDVQFIGFWSDFIRPADAITTEWFDAIVSACEDGKGKEAGPSISMMHKGMACGLMVSREGWEVFNLHMLSRLHDETMN